MSDRRAMLYGIALAALSASQAAAQDGYRKPPKAVLDILDAAPPPELSVSPTGEHLLLVHYDRYPPIADLAEPTLRLAGLRINPKTNGPARTPRLRDMTIMKLPGGTQTKLERPVGRLGFPVW